MKAFKRIRYVLCIVNDLCRQINLVSFIYLFFSYSSYPNLPFKSIYQLITMTQRIKGGFQPRGKGGFKRWVPTQMKVFVCVWWQWWCWWWVGGGGGANTYPHSNVLIVDKGARVKLSDPFFCVFFYLYKSHTILGLNYTVCFNSFITARNN